MGHTYIDTKRISLSYKATQENPWDKIKNEIGKETEIKVNSVTEKAIFGEIEISCRC